MVASGQCISSQRVKVASGQSDFISGGSGWPQVKVISGRGVRVASGHCISDQGVRVASGESDFRSGGKGGLRSK